MTAEGAETAENLNRITERVIGAAMRVHQALGPGLLESAYEACLAFELADSGMKVVQRQPLHRPGLSPQTGSPGLAGSEVISTGRFWVITEAGW